MDQLRIAEESVMLEAETLDGAGGSSERKRGGSLERKDVLGDPRSFKEDVVYHYFRNIKNKVLNDALIDGNVSSDVPVGKVSRGIRQMFSDEKMFQADHF